MSDIEKDKDIDELDNLDDDLDLDALDDEMDLDDDFDMDMGGPSTPKNKREAVIQSTKEFGKGLAGSLVTSETAFKTIEVVYQENMDH